MLIWILFRVMTFFGLNCLRFGDPYCLHVNSELITDRPLVSHFVLDMKTIKILEAAEEVHKFTWQHRPKA